MSRNKRNTFYPAGLRHTLDFDWIKSQIEGHLFGSLGKKALDKWTVKNSVEEARLSQTRIGQYQELLDRSKYIPNGYFEDITEEILKLPSKGFIFELDQLANLRASLHTTKETVKFINEVKEEFEEIGGLTAGFIWESEPLKMIDKIMTDEGEMRSDASPELVRIRRARSSKQKELDGVFRKVLRTMKKSGYLSETEETIRSGRRVLSVLSENKRSIPGIIHDESESGKSTFIEPMESVALHNDLAELDIEERKEIRRILKDLTESLRPFKEFFEANLHLLSDVDLLQAQTRFCQKLGCAPIKIGEHAPIRLIQAYHPHLLWHNREKGQDTIPLSLSLDHNERILVISGPNAGGKSIALKTLGILQMMVLHGLTVPASENSSFPFQTKILADIGDAQSIEDELSTYSSRLKRMNFFIREADENTLFLIDEFGTGTDPHLGGAIAEVILEKLAATGAYGIITTHYANLKALASQVDGLQNGRMIFDEQHLIPTFRLEQGKPGSSYTFEVAKNSGLPARLIKEARSRVASENVDLEDLLRQLQKDRAALESRENALNNEDRRLKQMMKQVQSMQTDLDQQKKRLSFEMKQFKAEELAKKESLLRDFEKEVKKEKKSKNELEEIRASLQKERGALGSDLKDLKKELFTKKSQAPIQEGSKVKMLECDVEGIVESIKKDKAKVRFGIVRTEVAISELVALETAKRDIGPKAQHKVTKNENAVQELDLRGMFAEDAMRQVEEFIDQAIMAGLPKVRIIHGKGKGRLRDVTWNSLKQHPHVTGYAHPPNNEGGDGVTIAEL